jgi:hypothetical protein
MASQPINPENLSPAQISQAVKHCANCGATIIGYSFRGNDGAGYCSWTCEMEKKAKPKPDRKLYMLIKYIGSFCKRM